jgi:predicted lipid-binding transport protein (Tim44 family)
MQTGFSFMDIVFLIILAVFIVSRFMGYNLPKDNKKTRPNKVLKFPSDSVQDVSSEKLNQKPIDKGLSHLKGVELIKKADNSFSEKEFLSGAELAYQMYYSAINEQDEETLESMMAPRKFDEIMEGIETLEAEGKKRVVLIDKIHKIEILDAKLHGLTAIIDVKYVVEQTDFIEDLSKDPKKVKQKPKKVTSVWTWAKSVGSDDLNWELETMALLS